METDRAQLPSMKRPGLAALLAFVFGPVGYLYLSPGYTLASCVSLFLFVKTLEIAHLTGPATSRKVALLTLAGFALEAARACRTKNENLAAFWRDKEKLRRANVAGPITAALELFVRLVLLYLGALGLLWSARSIISGEIARAAAEAAGTVLALWAVWWLLDLVLLVAGTAVLAGTGRLLDLWHRWRGVSEKSNANSR